MPDYSEKLKKYVEEAKTSFATSLEERIKRLATEEREEQLYGAEKLQQVGRFTSGFRTDLLTRVMDMFAGRRGEARGEYDERALAAALQMLGLGQQAELTREGYALQKYLASLTGGGVGGVGGVSYAPTYAAPAPVKAVAPTVTPKVAPKTTTASSTSAQAYAKAINTYYASLGQAQAYKPAITAAAKTAFGRAPGGVFY